MSKHCYLQASFRFGLGEATGKYWQVLNICCFSWHCKENGNLLIQESESDTRSFGFDIIDVPLLIQESSLYREGRWSLIQIGMLPFSNTVLLELDFAKWLFGCLMLKKVLKAVICCANPNATILASLHTPCHHVSWCVIYCGSFTSPPHPELVCQ